MKVDLRLTAMIGRFCLGQALLFLSPFIGSFIFVSFASFAALGATRVYIGSVGISEGSGLAGHSFAIIQRAHVPDLQADVYHYMVQGRDGKEPELADQLLTPGHDRLVASKLQMIQFYLLYAGMLDRVLIFHELDLTDAEAERFAAKLEADTTNANFSKETTYNAYVRNCVTRLLSLLNSSVSAAKRIQLIEDGVAFLANGEGPRANLSNALLNRIPYNLSRVLDRHPVSKGRVEIFERLSDTHLRYLLAMTRRVSSIRATCGWSDATTTTLKTYLARVEKNARGARPTSVLAGAAASCPAASCPAAAKDIGIVALLLSRSMLADEHFDERQALATLGVQLAAAKVSR